MSEPIDFTKRVRERETDQREEAAAPKPLGKPSNAVYARVGDTILRAAQDGVRRGLPPDDIIREIITEHGVRLTIGELRLLLAARRLPQ